MPVSSEKLQFIQQRIAQIRQFLLSNNNITSITTDDGMSTTFDRSGALAELKELERQEQRLLHPGGWMRNIDLSEAY
jgi:hypothetical protein